MAEMTKAGEHHCETGLVGSFDNVVIPHRTARLNYSCRACLGRLKQTIREGEEGVRRDDGTPYIRDWFSLAQCGVLALPYCDTSE